MPVSFKRNLTLYLILSFAISWAIWIPLALTRTDYQSSPFLLSAALIGAFGPGLAAILLNFLNRDLDQITEFRQRIYDFKRIRLAWYLIILAFWPVMHGIAIGITALSGEPIPESPFLAEILSKPNTIPLMVFLYFLQAGVEELGWRGYLQEKLGQMMSTGASSLLVGVIHAFWHLPLFWVVGTNQMKMGFGQDFLVFIGLVIATAVLTAWCYYGNQHSIMAVTLLHTAGNLSFDIFAYAPGTTKHLVFVLLTGLSAILVLICFQLMKRNSQDYTVDQELS